MKLCAPTVLFVCVLVLANCASTRPAARGNPEFDGFADRPVHRNNFAGIWQTTGDAQNYQTYEFRRDGTGSISWYNSSQLERVVHLRYKTSDSNIILLFIDFNSTNTAEYTFSGSNALALQNWLKSPSVDFNFIRIGDVPDDDYEIVIASETDLEAVAAAAHTTAVEKTTVAAAKSSKAPANRFNISGAFSWYPPDFFDNWKPHWYDRVGGEEEFPASYYMDHSYNIRLQMGLKLFKDLGAFIDFGLDENVAKGINLAAKLNAKWFSLQLDYLLLSSEIKFWEDTEYLSNEERESRPPDIIKKYKDQWMTVALMYTGLPEGFYLGAIYTRANFPQFIRTDVVYFLDECPIWAAGVRLGVGWDHNSDEERDAALSVFRTFNDWMNATLLMADIGFGKANPDDAKVAIAKANAINGFDDNFNVYYVRIYASMGAYKRTPFGKNKSWLFGFGLEANLQAMGILSNDIKAMGFGYNIGPYILGGLRF